MSAYGKPLVVTCMHDDQKCLQVSWLTPTEIFRPQYGRAIVTAILRRYPEKKPLNIIEVGGGSGRLAKDLLVC